MSRRRHSHAYAAFKCPTCSKKAAILINWETLTYDCIHCLHKHNTVYRALSEHALPISSENPFKKEEPKIDEGTLQNNLDFLKFLHESGKIIP